MINCYKLIFHRFRRCRRNYHRPRNIRRIITSGCERVLELGWVLRGKKGWASFLFQRLQGCQRNSTHGLYRRYFGISSFFASHDVRQDLSLSKIVTTLASVEHLKGALSKIVQNFFAWIRCRGTNFFDDWWIRRWRLVKSAHPSFFGSWTLRTVFVCIVGVNVFLVIGFFILVVVEVY